jgi:7-keto-8-aminopelargonate synthetase-like enzyme
MVMSSGDDRVPLAALTGSLRDYRDLQGKDLMRRVEGFFNWQDLRRKNQLWPYFRATDEAPLAVCSARDDTGRNFHGVNFASQDYLSLSSHPAIKEAGRAAISDYGVHSAGSTAFVGSTRYSLALQDTISEFLRVENTVLYPTGWAAGYGVIRGLVRPDDHVVIDALAHNCLQDGAAAATRNIHMHGHLSLESMREKLTKIRAADSSNGILVVTEGLFSMDSDTPDIAAMQELCREFEATLMVDVAHDLGNLGDDGTGHIGMQNMLGKVDIVMGSFSKTFASNGGFVSCNSAAVREYLKYYGSTCTFSNALSPSQSAIVQKAFDIVKSQEGRALRESLMRNVCYLRSELEKLQLEVTGAPSAIVAAKIGNEALARLIGRRLPALGVVANLVEFPAVAKGNARFRLQVMAKHRKEDIDLLIARLREAMLDASVEYLTYRDELSAAAPQTAQARRIA